MSGPAKRKRQPTEAIANRERDEARRRAAGIGPHQSPEELRRRAWAAVTEAKRRRVPFSDPRWLRSHEDAMAEEQAKERAA